MNEKEIVLTQEGCKKLEDELDDLKTVHRREVNERIRQAKEFGDISENAEYEDAKQEQAFVEGRILKLEGMIRNARIIDQSDYVADEVHLGATVQASKDRFGQSHEFTIVGSAERIPELAALEESPLGRALMGRKQVRSSTSRRRAVDEIQDRIDQKAAKKTKEASKDLRGLVNEERRRQTRSGTDRGQAEQPGRVTAAASTHSRTRYAVTAHAAEPRNALRRVANDEHGASTRRSASPGG